MAQNLSQLLQSLVNISNLELKLRRDELAELEADYLSKLHNAVIESLSICGANAESTNIFSQVTNREHSWYPKRNIYNLLKAAHTAAGMLLALLSTRCLYGSEVPFELETLKEFRRDQIASGESLMYIYCTSDFELYRFFPNTRILCVHNDDSVSGILTFSLATELAGLFCQE